MKNFLFLFLVLCSASLFAEQIYMYGYTTSGPFAGFELAIPTGNNLDYSSGIINAVSANWNATVGSPGYIVGKPTISTVGQTGQYSDLLGKPVIPNSPTIYRIRTTTATDGTYTWTFPTAFTVGTLPIVGITTEGSATINYQHTVTAISNTSVTVKVTPVQAVTVLGVSVLGLQSPTATTVHITAVAP